MTKIVLFNGPPRSGKDTATGFALEYLGRKGIQYRFAAPLKDAVHSLFGMSGIMIEHFDAVKDEPTDQFFGMSPRQAYIWMSEKCAKRQFGLDFFTRVAINALKKISYPNTVVISDCGFTEEALGLIEAFGVENVTLVYLERDGTSFANDSRSYITDVECKWFRIENNGSMADLEQKVKEVLRAVA